MRLKCDISTFRRFCFHIYGSPSKNLAKPRDEHVLRESRGNIQKEMKKAAGDRSTAEPSFTKRDTEAFLLNYEAFVTVREPVLQISRICTKVKASRKIFTLRYLRPT